MEREPISKPMDNCFNCGKLFFESALVEGNVKDQAGYIKKLFCKGCMTNIEGRSMCNQVKGLTSGKLLMEVER